jgi:hypothetical protein
MIIFKYISSTINSLSQLIVKHLGLGRADVQESTQISPFGLDSRPVKDTIGVRSDTSERGASIVLGYVLTNSIAKEGEFRTYATDSNGNEVAYTYMTNAGDLELNGKDDNAVRFSELKKVVDEIQGDIGTLKQAFTTWVPAPTDGGAALKAATATWFGTPLLENIDASKIDKVKVPKEG